MSKAHFAHRNFSGKDIVNLLAYGNKDPFGLSRRQKISRMYMSVLRIANEAFLNDNPHDSERFHETIYRLKNDFRNLKELNEYDSEFQRISKHWENFLANNFDIYGLNPDNRPYSLNACKYYIYSDEQLLADPFGYYKQERAVFGDEKPANSFYASDFPFGDDMWLIDDLEVGVFRKRNLTNKSIE